MATYYISPTGVDAPSPAGGTNAAPWRTWAYAFANSTLGDILLVKNGVYTEAANGTCVLSKMGTVSSFYTIRAENERQCTIQGVGGKGPQVNFADSSYAVLDGVRVSGSEADVSNFDNNMKIGRSHHVTIRRCIFDHNNRYKNCHLMGIGYNSSLDRSDFVLIEECEFYTYARHAVIFRYSNDGIVRRCYGHSRDFADIPGFPVSGYPATGIGDDFMTSYPGSRNIVENCIAENCLALFSVQAIDTTIDNKVLGSIGLGNSIPLLGDNVCLSVKARIEGGTSITGMPRNTLLENTVIINSNQTSSVNRGIKNTMINNCTFYGSRSRAVTADIELGGGIGDGVYTISGQNTLIVNALDTAVLVTADIDQWTFTNFNIYNSPATSPLTSNANGSFVNKTTINPNFGTVRCWVPDASPMKGAGVGGADIGANILYRYEAGILTGAPLWNVTTGEFPHGAIVVGLNDTATTSCYNVHTRLGVNPANFPNGYGGVVSDTTPPATPTGLQVS